MFGNLMIDIDDNNNNMFQRNLSGLEQANYYLKQKLNHTQEILAERDAALTESRKKVQQILRQNQKILTAHRRNTQKYQDRIQVLQKALDLKDQQCQKMKIQNQLEQERQKQVEMRLRQISKNIILRLFKFDNYKISKQIQSEQMMNIDDYIDKIHEIGDYYVDYLENRIEEYEGRIQKLSLEIRDYQRNDNRFNRLNDIREVQEEKQNIIMIVEEQKEKINNNLMVSMRSSSSRMINIPQTGNLFGFGNENSRMQEEQLQELQYKRSSQNGAYRVKIECQESGMEMRYLQSNWTRKSDQSQMYQ